ncbi:alpha/beta hydrolase domain-containing protein [Sphingobium sp. ZW T5_29]|uniref:alpha/beta hydrolase domain-containing protein n=1 Tax=Sphingobium sp. ZW T5_29 TaxID=3378077 RepID=UPI0038530B9C
MTFKTAWLAATISVTAIAYGSSAMSAPTQQTDPAQAARQVTIEGPVTGGTKGFPYAQSIVDLAPYGYTEAEYFVSGMAHPFKPTTPVLSNNGRWQVTPGDDLSYKTRILVRRPPAAKFNGTIVVEYMQEYFGTERDTNYRWNAETLLRSGFGWVGISMHHEGIDDANQPTSITYAGRTFPMVTTLARWDAARYGTLSVPSTDMSYDILTQVARALKTQTFEGGADPFAGLKVQRIMAAGNTVAGERLAIYINAVQPTAKVFDGFFLQDLHTGAHLKLSGVATPPPVVRTDVAVPVIVLNTTTASAERGARPEGKMLRFWAPAGSTHTTGPYAIRVAAASQRDFGMATATCPPDFANNLPVQYVSGAAIVAIDKWIRTGKAAPSFAQLPAFTGPKTFALEPADFFDANGNVKGGLRTPWVDVPVARYDWRGDCFGGSGRTFPFTTERLKQLYGTPEVYHQRFAKSARDAEKRGVLLTADVDAAIETANKVTW